MVPILIATTSSRLLDGTGAVTGAIRPTSTYVWLYLFMVVWIATFIPLAVLISRLSDDPLYDYNKTKRWFDGIGAEVQNGPVVGCVTASAYQLYVVPSFLSFLWLPLFLTRDG